MNMRFGEELIRSSNFKKPRCRDTVSVLVAINIWPRFIVNALPFPRRHVKESLFKPDYIPS